MACLVLDVGTTSGTDRVYLYQAITRASRIGDEFADAFARLRERLEFRERLERLERAAAEIADMLRAPRVARQSQCRPFVRPSPRRLRQPSLKAHTSWRTRALGKMPGQRSARG